MKSLLNSTLFVVAAVATAHASTINFVGEPTGVNDGQYYVTPYQITIDGKSQLVTCYDTHDEVSPGDTWQANILTLSQAASSGYFTGTNALAGYERVAWLDSQQYSNSDQQIGLQHAIWEVFGSAPSTPSEQSYDAAANAAAANAYAGFDFSKVRFVEEVGGTPGQNGTKQAFVFVSGAGNGSGANSPVPEPGSFVLLSGLAVVGLAQYRRRTA